MITLPDIFSLIPLNNTISQPSGPSASNVAQAITGRKLEADACGVIRDGPALRDRLCYGEQREQTVPALLFVRLFVQWRPLEANGDPAHRSVGRERHGLPFQGQQGFSSRKAIKLRTPGG